MKEIWMFSDGGIVNNGKKDKDKDVYGSYCCLLVNRHCEIKKKFVDVIKDTTNNRMELQGFIEACDYIFNRYFFSKDGKKVNNEKIYIHVYSDSQYFIKGCTEWMAGWKKRKWKNNEGKEISNIDMWKKIDEIITYPNYFIDFNWIRGHQGKSVTLDENAEQYFQEMCDTLATEALKEYR